MTRIPFISNLEKTYRDYPPQFWMLVLVTFIDHFGYFLLYPFFALYITQRFGVGMATVGLIYAVLALSSQIGSGLGGALSDRLGRRGIMIFSLLTTSLSSLLLGFVPNITAIFIITLVIGTLSETGDPTYSAMVADLLPEEKRSEGYAIRRVAFNFSMALGPAIGGFIAARSYLALFITDAVISLGTALLVYLAMPETKPSPQPGELPEGLGATFRGYLTILRDRFFVMFAIASVFSGLAFMNLNTTLGVFLRDVHGVSEQGYGFLLTVNATLVIVFQLYLTHRIQGKSAMAMMALGALILAIGVAMVGFVSEYALFILAIVFITFAEMIQSPTGQALVAKFSPAEMRARYMAMFLIFSSIPYTFGPYLGGLILDHLNPNLLWYAAGVVSLLSMGGFMHLRTLMDRKPDLPTEAVRAAANQSQQIQLPDDS